MIGLEKGRRRYLLLMVAGALYFAGWISAVSYFNISQKWAHEKELKTVETTVVPKLAAEAGCEHWRADQMKALALQPLQVGVEDLPKNCPHPKVSLPPLPKK